MSQALFKALLDKEFFNKNKGFLHKKLFTGEVKDLFEVLTWAYENDVPYLTVPALKELYATRCPADSQVKRNIATAFLDTIEALEAISPEAASLALRQSRINAMSDEAATLLLYQQDTKESKINEVRELLKEIETLEQGGETISHVVNLDIDYLLERTNQNCKWKFNIPALASVVPGLGSGIFCLIAGRVNSGKSLTSLSFCFGPGGFADQGARILYLCNEEHGAFTGLRAVSCFTGLTRQELHGNVPFKQQYSDEEKALITKAMREASTVFAPIRERVKIVWETRISMPALEKLVEEYRPDIVVCDMLDHLRVAGDYAREDLRLGHIYRQAREVANIYDCAFIGVSQTSAETDGKMHYGMDGLAGSKTDKPAACDLIALIGAEKPNEETGTISDIRAINIAKNKINGWHGSINAIIKPQVSRLVP